MTILSVTVAPPNREDPEYDRRFRDRVFFDAAEPGWSDPGLYVCNYEGEFLIGWVAITRTARGKLRKDVALRLDAHHVLWNRTDRDDGAVFRAKRVERQRPDRLGWVVVWDDGQDLAA